MGFLWNEVLIRPLLNLLVVFYNYIPGHDLGVAIILITIVIRLIILPSSLKAARSQKRLKDLTPQLNELKERYKGDQQGLAKAQMDFYKQNGVSPFSSCLPLLIQLPIIFALFSVLKSGLTQIDPTKIYPFIGNAPEKLNTIAFGFLNLATPEKYVLPFLAAVFQYILMVMTTPIAKGKSTSTEQIMSKQMLYMMPLITFFFGMSMPYSGITLYWVATTLFSLVQQWWVNKEKGKSVKIKIKKEGGEEVVVIEEVAGNKELSAPDKKD